MNLVIFGATGSVGRRLVDQALNSHHLVTAFCRHSANLGLDHINLRHHDGDVLDPAAVSHAVKGHDAVLITLGAGRKGVVRSIGTGHIIAAMKHHGVNRLICLSTLGAGDSRVHLNFFWKQIMFGLVLKNAYADHEAQEKLVRKSGLDWTIVRPAAFTDGSASDPYKHGFPPSEKDLKLKISRAGVAGFMLQQLTDTTYLHQSPGLSY